MGLEEVNLAGDLDQMVATVEEMKTRESKNFKQVLKETIMLKL